MNVDKVDDVLADITEVSEQMAQMNELFANPVGASAGFDEDELLNELEELDATQARKGRPINSAGAFLVVSVPIAHHLQILYQ